MTIRSPFCQPPVSSSKRGSQLRARISTAPALAFASKVTLGYLKPDAAVSAFRVFFGLEPPRGLAALTVLTLGDFEALRRKAAVLGQTNDAAAFTAMQCAPSARPSRTGSSDRVRSVGTTTGVAMFGWTKLPAGTG